MTQQPGPSQAGTTRRGRGCRGEGGPRRSGGLRHRLAERAEYNTAVKAKTREAMAGLLRDNRAEGRGAALTSELLSLDPAVADTAITRLVQEGTLGKIAEQPQQAASTNNAIRNILPISSTPPA